MFIGWPTHVLHENIGNETYVHELFNHFMQNYRMDDQWPTSNTDVDVFRDKDHYTPAFDRLIGYIDDTVRDYCSAVFGLGQQAANKLTTKTHVSNHNNIRGHQHSGSVVSGIFYIRAPKGGDLILSDPRSNAVRGYPDPFKHYFKEQIITPKDGDIIIFPSYLWHEVNGDNDEPRISMPFDTFYDYD